VLVPGYVLNCPILISFFFLLFRNADWIRVATEIELNYALFDAFVILHGTDTMAYTASALSFLLEDLGKTVVRVSQWCSPRNL
jgi:L-asparaginase/Glu-tRNA(Gln) amidotransferase subunit D